MSEDCNCDCEDSTTEFVMTILEGLTFLCAIFVTALYTWEFYDKYSKKKKRNRRSSNCFPRVQSESGSQRMSEELEAVFED
tara:strand:+ start:942 stop:1184 length:243 start_codon:yes stop_codon:yes gene_type:complete